MAIARRARNLAQFFRPESVVLVGASDKSPWSQLLFGNVGLIGYRGRIDLVNKRGAPAHGLPAATSCRALPEKPDLAYVFVPSDAVPEAMRDVADAGITNVVLLSSGFAETGAGGSQRQAELAALARARGLNLLGPNSLGFINYAARVAVSGFPVDEKATAGHVAVISQSGATAHVIAQFARMQGVGLSCVVATGNESDVGTADIIDAFIDDPETRVIALFAETMKDPAGFRVAASRASAANKAIVVLKVGKTELATKLAQAHTGSVTGDDRIFDAVCRQYGVVRVQSIEEMVVTAGLLAETGPVDRGIAIISISGGACEIIADRAAEMGLEMPPFSPETEAKLRAVMPDFGSVFNPLDVTGAAVRDPSLFQRILDILAADPAIGMTAAVQDLPSAEGDTLNRDILESIGRGLSASRTPGVLINQALRPVSAYSRQVLKECGIPAVTGGIEHAIAAFAALQRWSRRTSAAAAALTPAPSGARPESEYQSLRYLAGCGVPVVPQQLVNAAAEAVAAWRTIGGPVALKIASPDIQHKSDIGGVRLGLDDATTVGAAFDAIMAAARAAHPDAKLEGCIVAPMRPGGIELFVGTARSHWGPVIVAGLGGVWIEALADTSLRLLPVTEADAREMLGELRGRRLLDGYRGAPGADLDRVAAAIKAIGDAALALGPDLVSLEINPLLARGSAVEALDALAIWDDATPAH